MGVRTGSRMVPGASGGGGSSEVTKSGSFHLKKNSKGGANRETYFHGKAEGTSFGGGGEKKGAFAKWTLYTRQSCPKGKKKNV